MGVNKTLLPDEEEKDILPDPNAPAIGKTETGGTTVDGVTNGVTSGLTGVGSTAQPILGVPSYKGALPDYNTWMSENGYDPDKDYSDAKAAREYDFETSMATYGRRAEELAQMGLSNSGISDIYQLGAFNSYIQDQNALYNEYIEKKKQYRQDYNAVVKQSEESYKLDSANAYNIGLSLYDGTNIDFVRQQLTQQGYDASIVDGAIASLSALDVNTLPAVKAQQTQDATDIDNAFAALSPTYSKDKQSNIEAYYRSQGWSDEKIAKLISGLNAYTGIAGTDNKVEDAINAFFAANPNYNYDGSATSKEYIRQALGSEYAAYYDDVIAEFDSRRKAVVSAGTTDVLNKEVGSVSTGDMTSSLDKIKNVYGADSAEYADAQSKVSEKIGATATWALDPEVIGTSEAGAAFGYTNEEWTAMDDGEREAAIMTALGEYTKTGYMSQSEYNAHVKTWLDGELDRYIEIDKDNAKATGFRDAGSVVYTLMEWRDAGYMSEDDYKTQVGNVIGKMQFERGLTWNGMDEIKWYGTVDGAEGTVKSSGVKEIEGDVKTFYENNLMNAPKMRATGTEYIVEYNGKLYAVEYKDRGEYGKDAAFYYANVENVWELPAVTGLKFAGDGIARADDSEKIGMYEIVVYMLQHPTRIERNRVYSSNTQKGTGKNQPVEDIRGTGVNLPENPEDFTPLQSGSPEWNK